MCLIRVIGCILLCLINECINMPTGSTPMSDAEIEAYMVRYNYMRGAHDDPDSPLGLVQARYISKAIAAFQRKYNLNDTGILDSETRYWIQLPRCGMEDVSRVEDMTRKRKRRFTTEGSRWGRTMLTYKISRYPDELSHTSTDNDIARAFRVWEDVTPLRFTRRTSGFVDIEILFQAGEHGDGNPFDGRGGVLAHAYFPRYGGDAHFDDDEMWTVNSYSGTNLFEVAAHEFGHSLGLGHSSVREALMAPFYAGYDSNFALHMDDIDGIQHLYGPNVVPATQPTPFVPRTQPTPLRGIPDFCGNAHFDTVTLHELNGEPTTFVFQGSYYARLSRSGMVMGYPRRISDDWPGLEGNIDAALYWETMYEYAIVNGRYQRVGIERTGRTYFFKGNRYWRYENMALIDTYPRDISANWPGLPNNLDAALVWSGNDSTYFIKGDQYYRYSIRRGVDAGYPRPLSVWIGLPASIDAAVQWLNSRTYFFTGTRYYRFDDQNFRVDTNNYPRENNYWWIGCRGMNMNHEDDSSVTVINDGDGVFTDSSERPTPSNENGDGVFEDSGERSTPLNEDGDSNNTNTSKACIFTLLIPYVFIKVMSYTNAYL